jgi:hypothetical protein
MMGKLELCQIPSTDEQMIKFLPTNDRHSPKEVINKSSQLPRLPDHKKSFKQNPKNTKKQNLKNSI